MEEIHQYQPHQPPEQSQPPQQQPQPVFEQWQQPTNFQSFNHANLQYNYNNYNYNNYNYHPQQQQQPQQIFPQFQNIQTNHHGISPSYLNFHAQRNLELEQHQRRLQLENNHNHHYQQPFFSRDNNNNYHNNNNNFRGFITGDGSSIIPIPSTPSYLNGNFRCRNDNDVTAFQFTSFSRRTPSDLNGNGRCRNDNDVTGFQFTSLARPSHFWRKSGHDINEADENDKHREYHNHNHEEEMNQNQKQNYGYDDHDRQESSKSCRRYLSELEELCGRTCTSSPAAIISLPPPPPPTISNELIINNLIAQKAGKRVVNEEVEQKMPPSLSTMADHDHDRNRRKRNRKRRKRSRERDEEMERMQTLANQVVESMEAFYMKLCERIEKLEKERKEREDCWRRRGMENFQSQFSVSSKSHIENRALPTNTMAPPTTRDDPSIVAQTIPTQRIILSEIGGGGGSKRWPEEEVDALIELRINLAERFREQRFKWSLWEEISNRMSSMGFHHRDARRCKDKWDNIIKYYKKLRQQQQQDGRRQKLKTCVYFDKLDQFYNSNSSSIDNGGCYGGGGGNVDL